MSEDKQLKLLVRLTVVNTVLVGLCVLLLIALVLGMRAPKSAKTDLGAVSADYVIEEPPEESGMPRTNPDRNPLENFLDTSIKSLGEAVEDAGGDPASILPSPADVQAAKASGSLDSEATQLVMAELRKGFAKYNMKFPDPSLLFPKRPGPPPGAARP